MSLQTGLQNYRYSGPVSGAAINHNGRVLDVRLHPNKTVQLPAEHEYTQTLVGLRYLTQVETPASPPPPAPDAETKGTSADTPKKPQGKKAAQS